MGPSKLSSCHLHRVQDKPGSSHDERGGVVTPLWWHDTEVTSRSRIGVVITRRIWYPRAKINYDNDPNDVVTNHVVEWSHCHRGIKEHETGPSERSHDNLSMDFLSKETEEEGCGDREEL